MNKALAADWYTSQLQAQKDEEVLDEQRTALFYAANKRDGCNWPDPEQLGRLGYTDAANKVRQAYGLLAEAQYSFSKQHSPELYNK